MTIATDTRYVSALPAPEQAAIAYALRVACISGDNLADALDSRVCDLADVLEPRTACRAKHASLDALFACVECATELDALNA